MCPSRLSGRARTMTCVDDQYNTPDRVTIFMVVNNRPWDGRLFTTIAGPARAQVTGLRRRHRAGAVAQRRAPRTDIGVLIICESEGDPKRRSGIPPSNVRTAGKGASPRPEPPPVNGPPAAA